MLSLKEHEALQELAIECAERMTEIYLSPGSSREVLQAFLRRYLENEVPLERDEFFNLLERELWKRQPRHEYR